MLTETRIKTRTGDYAGETISDDQGVVLATVTRSRLRAGDAGAGFDVRTYFGPEPGDCDLTRYASLRAARSAAIDHARAFEG